MLSKKEIEIQVLCEEFYKALSQFQNVITFNKKMDTKNIDSAIELAGKGLSGNFLAGRLFTQI